MVLYRTEPVVIVNYHYDLSENVEVFNTIPQRVITTNGSATELLLALGLAKHMVGTAYLDNPPLPEHKEAYDGIPIISRQYPGKEQVLALEPDLIVGWHSAFAPQVLGDPSNWNKLGVSTMILRDSSSLPKRITNIYDDINDLGRIFDVEEKAEKIISDMRSELDTVTNLVKERGVNLKVLVLQYQEGGSFRSRGDDSTIGQMLIAIGAANVFPRSGARNKESIAAANPDAIVFMYMDSALDATLKQMESFRTDPILKYTTAVKDNRMGIVPLSETYCPGVRFVMGVRHISEIIFP
jgi:iron complex transport system substrate-binding protein